MGIAALEDKIVQQSLIWVLNAIYEEEFLGFSYGFRPKRSQHDALDAIYIAITQKKVSWVLDADIKGFFDNLNHDWLMKFIGHKIKDKRIQRLIESALRAGIKEADGRKIRAEAGTPQGAVISPLLANIYLHYVLDLWGNAWRAKRARGEIYIVRYADDFVVGFQYQDDGKRFHQALEKRLKKFDLKLHEQKTRLLEFGRYAAPNRKQRGESKSEIFDFIGFTHIYVFLLYSYSVINLDPEILSKINITHLLILQNLIRRAAGYYFTFAENIRSFANPESFSYIVVCN